MENEISRENNGAFISVQIRTALLGQCFNSLTLPNENIIGFALKNEMTIFSLDERCLLIKIHSTK